MNLAQIYQQATGVDISKQQALWDERGKGYYGEYRVFSELYPYVPGTCKILMNLQVPVDRNKSTEIDLVLIHETGVYVFEVKHYKGTIYGRAHDKNWTQYFRTTSNSSFGNPIAQNDYHIHALKNLLPNVPLFSFVVFTNTNCELKIQNDDPQTKVCTLTQLRSVFSTFTANKQSIFSLHKIDDIFNVLKPLSNLKETTVTLDAKPVLFYDCLDKLKETFETARKQIEESFTSSCQQLENEYQKKKETLLTQSRVKTAVTIVIPIITIIVSIIICSSFNSICNTRIDAAEAQLLAMKQKFTAVGDLDDENITFTNQLVSISNISLKNSRDIDNTAIFTCHLTATGEKYGIWFLEDTNYVVKAKDGRVYEYKMFDNSFSYNAYANKLGPGSRESGDLKEKEFYNITAEEIAFIKVTNVGVWKSGANYGRTLLEDMEIELYSANT